MIHHILILKLASTAGEHLKTNKQTKKTNIIPAKVRLECPKKNTFPLINRGWPQKISWPVTVFKMAGQHGGFTKPDACSDVFLADEFQV